MTDPRIAKMADVLINYSLEIKPGQQLVIVSNHLANELVLAAYEQAIKAGANVFLWSMVPEAREIFLRHASDAQLEYVSPIYKLVYQEFDAMLNISAEQNTRALRGTDPARQARTSAAHRPYRQSFFDRAARGELRWVTTEYPTHASAQEADMSLADYQDFVFSACKLNDPDPVARWREEGERQIQLQRWLADHDEVVLKGADIDLRMSIKGRRFEISDGRYNFPDGEIFTGPVENSVNGWVRFRHPAAFNGREVIDIELWFEDGKVVRERAAKGQEFLTEMLNMDAGSRYLGEWGIGTNYEIKQVTKNMLFDEKIGGTIHLALGASYPETGGVNESGLHWDMLCDMSDSEITIDGELFYRNGRPVMWEAEK